MIVDSGGDGGRSPPRSRARSWPPASVSCSGRAHPGRAESRSWPRRLRGRPRRSRRPRPRSRRAPRSPRSREGRDERPRRRPRPASTTPPTHVLRSGSVSQATATITPRHPTRTSVENSPPMTTIAAAAATTSASWRPRRLNPGPAPTSNVEDDLAGALPALDREPQRPVLAHLVVDEEDQQGAVVGAGRGGRVGERQLALARNFCGDVERVRGSRYRRSRSCS